MDSATLNALRHGRGFLPRTGPLFVHKAPDHFDLLNWHPGTDPGEVMAAAELRK